jgi:aryl-alcohol dehydrogenase-like predicted oxidoreductase
MNIQKEHSTIMEYRKLGNSGALVSALALGTMNFGTPETPEDEAFAQLDAFIEAGGNLIDTADVYNGGVAEETLGRWLAARPREVTDRAVIATKGAWDPLTPIEESLSFLDSAVRTGKIRYAGLSNFTGWQLQLAVVSPQQACTWTRMR